MTFKLAQSAETSWHRLRGYNQLPKIIMGIKFNDGIEVVRSQARKPLPPDPVHHRDSGNPEKHEPACDIDTVAVDSLKVLDPKRPIREADMAGARSK